MKCSYCSHEFIDFHHELVKTIFLCPKCKRFFKEDRKLNKYTTKHILYSEMVED